MGNPEKSPNGLHQGNFDKPDQRFSLIADPVITYDHMDDKQTGSMRYFSQTHSKPVINNWSLYLEESIIALMLAILLLTQ